MKEICDKYSDQDDGILYIKYAREDSFGYDMIWFDYM